MGNNDYLEFGFGSGDENLGGGKFTRFKGKEGEKYRMSFVWWRTKADGTPNLDPTLTVDGKEVPNSPKFVGAKRFFIQNVGYFLDKGPEYAKIAGGPSKVTVGTVICCWPIDRKGQLDKARFAEGDCDVLPWVFSKDRYDELARRNDEFSFTTCDLNVTCTDTQFQKMDTTPCRESLFRKCLENEKLRHISTGILAKVAQIVGANEKGEPMGLRDMIARDMSIDKIREKMGGGSASSSSHTPHTTMQVDDILDDLVDP